ncbi:MAG: radical SAM protein [Acidobacteriota bacterium]|nr:radical SAM protein [Acidobacteriota bacterium]
MTPEIEAKAGRIENALAALSEQETACFLCPRNCGVDRRTGRGVCRAGTTAVVSHALLHFGEEPVLSGDGSGTIFFAGCNLACRFCQNYQISWFDEGRPAGDDDLADMMLDLRDRGALNINFVSPTHLVLPILRGLRKAVLKGLDIPLVYNSNGYDSAATLKELGGVIDIYLPDAKYVSPDLSSRYSGAADYFERAATALIEMHRQQPRLEIDEKGAALKGLIIRHLVLPGCGEDSLKVLRWIRDNLSPSIGLSIMSQYRPCHWVPEELNRTVTPEEYGRVVDFALSLDFENLFIQPEPFGPDEHLVPDFRLPEPFRWKG